MNEYEKNMMDGLQAGIDAFSGVFNLWVERMTEVDPAQLKIMNDPSKIRVEVGMPIDGKVAVTFIEVRPDGDKRLFALHGRDYRTN